MSLFGLRCRRSSGGNRPDGIRDLRAVLEILWLHTWNGTIFAYLGVAALLQSWKVFATAGALAVLAGAAVLLGPKSFRPGARLVVVASVALLLAWLLVMLPPSTNKRLHDWCNLNVCTSNKPCSLLFCHPGDLHSGHRLFRTFGARSRYRGDRFSRLFA